jgi:hypothetical protein
MIDMLKFIFREYGLTLLPIVVSVIGVLYSNHFSRNAGEKAAKLADEANIRSQEANDLAREALKKSETQFVETNRPQLTAQPLLQNNHSYYGISKINEKRIHTSLSVVIQNKGNVVASSTLIEEATFRINYQGTNSVYATNFYDGLGNIYPSRDAVPQRNFTLIDIQPYDGYARKLEFEIDLSNTLLNADQILQLQPNFAITINLRLVCTYELIEGKQFITHTSHGITKDGISVLENRIGVYESSY